MRLRLFRYAAMAALALAAPSGHAQASTLQPFTARYEVLRDGKSQGEAVMRLEHIEDARWRFSSDVRGTSGMARLSGFEMRESTDFEALPDGRLKPLSARAEGGISLRRRSIGTEFDWGAKEVRWNGDAKPEHRGPAPLGADTVNPQLLNLALAQRLRAGAAGVIRLDMVNRGNSSAVEYRVRGSESVRVPMGEREAIALHHRRTDKDREITLWIDPSLPPAPLRVLQREDGEDAYELRLIELR
ncbi:DUF3108 domain-containing protein [Aquimonas voraii]|uniref:DUF3108 domain-containing protein n=1 Tax=Aquimonas voraii TaxID=265719 RepID=A0A1G6S0M8_9GAMM|nr:DUF3108 domain-containing protein [Aquimonas voraii]SDD10388.1 Protein of unknown function [Aquimonas voraii]